MRVFSAADSAARQVEPHMSRTQDPAPAFRKPPTQAAHGQQVSMRKGAFLVLTGLLIAFGSCTAAGLGYVLWRDEALLAISSRHARIERSYEEQVSALRRELARVNSQRVLEEAAVEARVRELWDRQAQIEKRTHVLSAIATGRGQTTVEQAPKSAGAPPPPATRPTPAPGIALPALGFAPPVRGPSSSALEALEKATPPAVRTEAPATQRPEADAPAAARPGLRGAMAPAQNAPDAPETAVAAASPLKGNLVSMVAALDRVEQMQVGLASLVGQRARRDAQRLEALANEIGIRPDRIARASSAQGGPFVPLDLDPNGSAFDREILHHQDDIARADRLRRLLSSAPLGRPAPAGAEQTSGFGSRIDPFLGRPAQHTGIDFRAPVGSPAFATAPGRVVAAGYNGGYGLMVEIDHGAGITTRYAHLSAILVEEGESVPAQKPIGRIGSTGRSTGPHLHYEVRIDDEPVDPARFLRAGVSFASLMAAQDR